MTLEITITKRWLYWLAVIVVTGVLLSALLTACADTVEVQNEKLPENEAAQWTRVANMPDGYGIYRFVDSEMGVVCWLYEATQRAGISCLPSRDLPHHK